MHGRDSATDRIAESAHPPIVDHHVVTAPDGTVFVCWVEGVDSYLRWIFVTSGGAMYVGPVYRSEPTLEAVQATLCRWRETNAAMARALVDHGHAARIAMFRQLAGLDDSTHRFIQRVMGLENPIFFRVDGEGAEVIIDGWEHATDPDGTKE